MGNFCSKLMVKDVIRYLWTTWKSPRLVYIKNIYSTNLTSYIQIESDEINDNNHKYYSGY